MSPGSSKSAPGRKRKTNQSPGSEGLTAGRAPSPRPAPPTAVRSIRVSNQAERAAREVGQARGGAEAAHRLKGEPELPFRGWPAVAEAVAEAAAGLPLLPAWVASYTNPTTLALLGRRALEAQPESIPAGDDRQRVADTQDTTAFPWRCLCRLDITSANGRRYLGTGWLAGPRTVITAGHCVYLQDDGGWASQVKVVPAYQEGSAPFGSFTSSDLHSVTGWTEQKAPPHDYGAILLPQALSTGFLGYAVYADEELSDQDVNVYGYPGDKNQGSALWGHFRKLYRVTAQQLFYNLATWGGQSGCPVWVKDGDDRVAVGIHNYGGDPANYATRITDAVFDDIGAWKAGPP